MRDLEDFSRLSVASCDLERIPPTTQQWEEVETYFSGTKSHVKRSKRLFAHFAHNARFARGELPVLRHPITLCTANSKLSELMTYYTHICRLDIASVEGSSEEKGVLMMKYINIITKMQLERS